MLLITRRLDESVQIGDDIWVTITRLGRSTVRLGIQAPDHVHIRRTELAPLTKDERENHERR